MNRAGQMVVVLAGVAAGIMVAGGAARELFVVGIDDKERKALFSLAAVGFATWGLGMLVDLDEHWYLTTSGIGQKLESEISK